MVASNSPPSMVAGRHGEHGGFARQAVVLASGTEQESVIIQGIMYLFMDSGVVA